VLKKYEDFCIPLAENNWDHLVYIPNCLRENMKEK